MPSATWFGDSAEGQLSSLRSLLTLLSWAVLVPSHAVAWFLGDLDDARLTQPSPGDMVASVTWGSLHQYWKGMTDLDPRDGAHWSLGI